MNRFTSLFLLMLVMNCAYAQPDTTNVSITNYRLLPGTFSWRGTGTYFDRTTFESAPYTEGHLRRYNGEFRQNFRLLFPNGWDANYKPGYPLFVIFHGAVERANCHNGDCYHGTTSYNPNTAPVVTPESDIDNLLNNDHHLIHGAVPHLNAVNLAGTKKPNDPSLGPKELPGFVLFPQMFNGWYQTDIRDAIRTVRLLLKKYNIDPNRVYIHGLSNGGRGVMNALVDADWLFAAAAPMSAITSHQYFRDNLQKVAGIPIWWFQGGMDTQPTPTNTETTIRLFREAGGVARYTLYPTLGHGTWNTAYKEPDFFSWFLGKNKSDIQIAYGSPTICTTTGAPAKLSVARGFPAYQWEFNGQIIAGANSYTYDATTPGVYRARFSRVSATPTEDQWNQWSKPVSITQANPPAPVLGQVGSIVLRDLNLGNTARLSAPEGFQRYYWFKDGQPTTISNTLRNPSITPGSGACAGPCPNSGTYTVVTASFDNCPSLPSNPKTVFFSDQAPINIPTPTGLTATLSAATNVLLRWNDVSGSERNYELWRRKSTDDPNRGWTFVALINEDVILYEDKNLDPGTEYWYKLRAVSNLGRSNYAPGNSKTNRAENVIISTQVDSSPPTAPQNATATLIDTDIATKTASIQLTWTASTDNGGIKQYTIQYGGNIVETNSTATSYTLSNLPLNTYFSFKVYAVDRSNNTSTPSNQADANTFITGLYYYHGTGAYTDIRDIPDSYWTTPEFKGKTTNLTLEPRTQEDFLIFKFYGYVYISTPGQYLFRVRSNDGVQMYIDGNLVLRRNGLVNDGECRTTNFTTGIPPVNLTTGPHSIEIRYFQYSGDKCLSFQWQGPDAGPIPTRWYDVPDTRIRSYETLTPPPAPVAPENLTAVATGMTTIDLAWTFNATTSAEFEIYRSLTADGTFNIINRVSTLTYTDQNLAPGTTYYYKVRAVNDNGTSAFTPVASATTDPDTQAPTPPLNLTLYSKTLTTASIGWTAATDNTGVTGYEIMVNGILHSTVQTNFTIVSNLLPMTNYEVYVVAVDANGNKSEPSNTISFATSEPEIFYSKAAGNLNDLATWGKQPDGTGAAPINFTTNGTYFIVSNRTNTTLGGPWRVEGSVSKVIIPAGVTLTTDNLMQGRVEVANDATIVLANAGIPTFVDLGLTSTVQYAQTASSIQKADYGNLSLTGTGTKTFDAGSTTVRGNLTVANGLAVKGAGNNQSTVILFGDMTYSGSQGFTPADVSIAFELRKNGVQKMNFSTSIDFYQIRTGGGTTLEFVAGGTPGTITLGSDLGGGLSLASGSRALLGGNTLRLIGKGTVNPAGETGTIGVNGGQIDITSAASANSNLYFTEGSNSLANLTTNLIGPGNVTVQSALLITDGVKIKAGTLNANGKLTLVSTASKTANLQEIETNGRVIGNVNVQRYVNAKPRVYRYISSPVEGLKVADWQQFFAITGTFAGASTGPGLLSNPSMFIWEPGGYVAYPTSTNQEPIQRGRGYAAFIRNTEPMLMVNTGVPYQGTVPFTINQPVAGDDFSGWSLLGNPYASTIQWTTDQLAWPSTNMSTIVAVRNNINPTTAQYQYYDAATGLGTTEGGLLEGGRIAPGQAFWTFSSAAGATLSVTEKAKSTGQQILYREDASPVSHLRVNLTQNDKQDQAIIMLTDFASNDFDKGYDAIKIGNTGVFNLSTMTLNNVPVAMNNLLNEFCSKSVWLSVDNAALGTYTLSVESPETLFGVGTLTLKDHFNNTTVDLMQENSYQFSITSDAASHGSARFELVFDRPSLDLNTQATASIECDGPAKVVLTNTQPGATYTVMDLNGKIVASAQESHGANMDFILPADKLINGTNEFQIQASFKGCSSAMLAQRVTFEHYAPISLQGNDVSICKGESANLKVTSSGEVTAYEWYKDNTLIKGVSGPEFKTDAIETEAYYEVAALSPNGCTSGRTIITVTPEEIEEPHMYLKGDTIFATVPANLYEWALDGELLHTSNVPYFVPKFSGNYSLTVKTGGCFRTSKELTLDHLENNAIAYELYPNPATSENVNLRVVTREPGDVLMTVMDALGKEVYRSTQSDEVLKGGIRVKFSQDLRPGMYFMILEQNSNIRKLKFIIKN